MKAPPSLDELEIELSTGSGVAIIVEGNSYEDDPWFYGQWFGDRAREVTFYPQNGWHQVVAAVSALRERSIGVPVYGIIDRDFCEDHELDAEFESKGTPIVQRQACSTETHRYGNAPPTSFREIRPGKAS